MKRQLKLLLSAVLLGVLAVSVYGAQAEEAVKKVVHSGNPYSLNIVVIKDRVSCDDQKDEAGNPVYGNTIYVPANGNNIKIKLQSVPGNREGEASPLQVIDRCTASFDSSAAAVQIPKNAHGYRVYAKPSGTLNPTSVMNPQLTSALDEEGNRLVYLGQLNVNGFETAYGSMSKRKGQWTPEDITPLLEWSGTICSLSCTGTCYQSTMCCTPVPVAPGPRPRAPLGASSSFSSCKAKDTVCPAGTVEAPAYCSAYEDEWMLNLPLLAGYLSGSDAMKLEVLFYPVK